MTPRTDWTRVLAWLGLLLGSLTIWAAIGALLVVLT